MWKTYLAKLIQAGTVTVVAVSAAMSCGGDGDSGARTIGGGKGGSNTGTGGGGGGGGSTTPNTANDVCGLPTDTGPDPVLYNGATEGAECGTTINTPYAGYWFKYDDQTLAEAGPGAKAMTMVAAKGGCQSDCAIHATGAGFTDYGAGVGFDIKDDASQEPTNFDASAYGGIQFFAKGTLTGTRGEGYSAADNNIHLKVLTATERDGDDFGGYCEITPDWKKCQFPFSELTRDGFNSDIPAGTDKFEIDKLQKIQFEFSRNSDSSDPVSFDVWIDNVAFYGKPGATGEVPKTNEDECGLPETDAPDPVLYTSGGGTGGACQTTANAPYGTSWFKYDDKTLAEAGAGAKAMTMVAEKEAGCQHDCAIHTSGAGFTDYGAGIGFDVKAGSFDASAYTGIQFFAKGTLSGTRGTDYSVADNVIHLKLPTATEREGDDFGAYCPIAEEWTKCKVNFSDLARDGFNDSLVPTATDEFDKDKLLKVQFEFSRASDSAESTTRTPLTFDVWIDNVSFF